MVSDRVLIFATDLANNSAMSSTLRLYHIFPIIALAAAAALATPGCQTKKAVESSDGRRYVLVVDGDVAGAVPGKAEIWQQETNRGAGRPAYIISLGSDPKKPAFTRIGNFDP